ncbi:MAG: DUF805 domain-containing protein [Actinomycetota bacterium]
MTFQESIRSCLRRFADFGGRAGRPEYWWFVLFTFLASSAGYTISEGLGDLVGILLFLPGLAAAVRRLHDADHSAWALLVGLIPVIGWVVLLVWLTTVGTAGPNRFGAGTAEPVPAR